MKSSAIHRPGLRLHGDQYRPMPEYARPRVSKKTGIPCPNCGTEANAVLDSRAGSNGTIRRRRGCVKCGWRFTTYEIVGINAVTSTTILTDMRQIGQTLEQVLEDVRRLQGQLMKLHDAQGGESA